MAKLTTKFKSLKKTTKVDFATYLGVIAVFIVVTVLQNGGMLNRKHDRSARTHLLLYVHGGLAEPDRRHPW